MQIVNIYRKQKNFDDIPEMLMNSDETQELRKSIKEKGTINIAFYTVLQKKYVETLGRLNNVNYNTSKDLKTSVQSVLQDLEKVVEVIST
mmetsp:Transcript_13123/g.28352  ORF Transcript_13123/g.28352 Transcript_13123/m.28352 type:complete len:90 (+) Transcript_13123:5200-5469(+)